MNVFLPFVDNIEKSIRCLDDRRLSKQILECQTMVDVYNGAKGYSHHPIVKHYTSTTREFKFLRYYAHRCCKEYEYRFGKKHAYASRFPNVAYFFGTPQFVPIYIEGKKPYQLIETDPRRVEDLFQEKLILKWMHDKYIPKWTKRPIPKFLEETEHNPTFLQNISVDEMIQIVRIIKQKENEENEK